MADELSAAHRIRIVSAATVNKLLLDLGSDWTAFQRERIQSAPPVRNHCDEIWPFVGAKLRNIPEERNGGCHPKLG